MGIKGDMKGDGMQTGGTIVVSKGGGNVLLLHKQTSPGDHADIDQILKVLGIEKKAEGATAAAEVEACTKEACTAEEAKDEGSKEKEEGTKPEEKKDESA